METLVFITFEELAGHGHHERDLHVNLGGIDTVEGTVQLGIRESVAYGGTHGGFVFGEVGGESSGFLRLGVDGADVSAELADSTGKGTGEGIID